jgi:hypothetical protein
MRTLETVDNLEVENYLINELKLTEEQVERMYVNDVISDAPFYFLRDKSVSFCFFESLLLPLLKPFRKNERQI